MGANNIEIEVERNVPEDFRRVIRYLTNFERPEGLPRKKYLQFQRHATKFLLRNGILFRHSKPNMPPKRVVWDPEERIRIISELHDQDGHEGRQGTYSKVALRYWWPRQYREVEAFVKTYEACQKRKPQYGQQIQYNTQ